MKYLSWWSSVFFSFGIWLQHRYVCATVQNEKRAQTIARDEAMAMGRVESSVSDTCSRMVRQPRLWRGVARRDVAPYCACNMHVSIRTLSNISFRSIYPNAFSCGHLSCCELYSISRFPPVCRRRARHKQARRCKKASVRVRIELPWPGRNGSGSWLAGQVQSPLCPDPWLRPHLELSTGTSTFARVRHVR